MIALALCASTGCKPPESGHETHKGLLQFHVEHNLDTSGCTVAGNCFLRTEEEDDLPGWLDEIGANSDMAVLHWDRGVPWTVFAESPTGGEDIAAFYDARLDPGLKQWIDGFATHFESASSGYLAVSVLAGSRNTIANFLAPSGNTFPVAGVCPVMAPGTQVTFTYDDGAGPVNEAFDLEVAYQNFLLYLIARMQPDELALMVEVNLFREFCPAQWPGVVQLYRNLYDAIRPQVPASTEVFATLTFAQLLDYDTDTCTGGLKFDPCTGPLSPDTYPAPDPQVCYPLDLGAITDLDDGGRLEVLALSYYPDGQIMAVTGTDEDVVRVFPDGSDGTGTCSLQARLGPYLSPFDQLDRFGWSKPIAMAETSTRSCHTWASIPANPPLIVEAPGSPESQLFWMEQTLAAADKYDMRFVVGSFLRDYPPLGLWVLNQGVLPPDIYSVFNTWPCSGVYDASGNPKDVTDTWR